VRSPSGLGSFVRAAVGSGLREAAHEEGLGRGARAAFRCA
jgi:hypothetical protein